MTIQLNGKTPTKICMFQPSKLPAAYQEVEYIESSGTQYINTGYTPNIDTEIETDISWGTQTENWAAFFGVTGNDSSVDGILARIYDNSAGKYNPWFCNAAYGEAQITITTDTFNNIILKKNGGSINGTSYTLTTSGTPYQSTMDIFAGNNGGTHGWRASKCKIKTFKISESGILARNFVPCYRIADSVIGMYDLVNNVFYTNSGTGTFTKGNDVNLIEKEIKRVTIYPDGVTEKQIRPSNLSSYSVDFRNNSQANLEADGYSFIGRSGPSYGFDANGLAITNTGSSQLAVGKYLNTASFNTFTATITTQVNNNINGGGTFVHAMPQGQNIWDGDHIWCLLYNAYGLAIQGTRYGTRPTTGEHTFTFIVNLDTGAASATDSDGQSVSTTLSATELTYIKGNNVFIGCLLDSNVHRIKTLDVLFE